MSPLGKVTKLKNPPGPKGPCSVDCPLSPVVPVVVSEALFIEDVVVVVIGVALPEPGVPGLPETGVVVVVVATGVMETGAVE